MRVTKLCIAVFLLLVTGLVAGQNGFIRGTVYDGKTGEYLPGVTVYVEGTTTGALTDLDGAFNISIAPGTYQIRATFISYEPLYIKDILVESGEATVLDNLRLEEATIVIEEAVVTAKRIRNTESAMLTMKKKSANLLDGISSAEFKKIGDSNAAASMKRVTGVSVEGGKYVFVRGLGDRYTKTILNGLDIPGLDPDRNTIQMDIFPTSIIDNLVVNKSFSAELPADFTGGVIDINIKDFPENKKADVSVSAAYNPVSHFRSNYLTYDGGGTDFLGFDDGTRDIPATTNIPFFTNAISNPDGSDGARYKNILQAFNPTMAASRERSLMDFSLGVSTGNQVKSGRYTMGYIFSLSYKNSTDFYEDVTYGRYGLKSDPDAAEMEVRENQVGSYGMNNILISGLAGFALKTQHAKYRINILHLQNGESQAGVFDYAKSNQGTEFSGFQHNLQYSQRSLSNLMINGKYAFIEKSWELEWKLSPTISRIKDPDIRFTRYLDRDGSYSIGTEVGFPERIWRELDEINLAGVIHATRSFKVNNENAKLKFGMAYTYKERNFTIQNFMINVRNIPLAGDPDELFRTENLWPYNGNLSRGTTYEAAFIPVNPNTFDSNVRNMAGYASVELSPVSNLKAVVGLRIENYIQYYTGQDQLGHNVLNNDKVLDNFGVFPALNFIFNLNDKQNIRLSYAKTIARPSFKELSYAEIYDPITGRTFIGGLFRDANDFADIEYWDGDLECTDIHNFDFRWELFHLQGQTVSASLFYKKFKNPIEIVQFATQTGSFQPRNVGDGQVLGAEVEIRQSLHLVSEQLKNLSVALNFTYTDSRIELSETEHKSRAENARTGQDVGKYRDMAGQAPFIINAGLTYSRGEKGFWQGFDAGFFYHVQGQTLQYVSIVDRPDIYTVPFHSLNFNTNKSFGNENRFQFGLKIENILNDKKEAVFKSFHAADRYFSRLRPATTFQAKLSYSF